MQIIWQPLINLLVVFYHLLFNNLGLAIIGFTFFIRFLMVPLMAPQLRMSKKMNELKPELDKLKHRHAGDKVKFAQAQADFYKEKGVNPISPAGCLPIIIQSVILLALFQGFTSVLFSSDTTGGKLNNVLYEPLKIEGQINTSFLGIDLAKPNVFPVSGLPIPLPGVIILLSALFQLLSSKMMAPQVAASEKKAKKTPGTTDDAMVGVQKQMLYLFPLMTIFIGYSFPSGLALYWGIFSAAQMVQQYFTSGWGGLTPWVSRLGLVESDTRGKERH